MKMNDMDDGRFPLPPEWLPAPQAPEDHPVWRVRADQLMSTAGPELARLAGRRRQEEFEWWSVLADWWRPSAALASVAAAVLLFIAPSTPAAVSSGDDLTLRIVAGEGSPVAIWKAIGVGADPVLALLAFENHDTFVASDSEFSDAGGNGR
jgi:hypothetical protein